MMPARLLFGSSLALALALTGAGCKNDQPAPPPPPKATAPSVAAPAAGPKGTLAGSVAYTGKPLALPDVSRQADAYCAKTPTMKNEEVIVNPNGTLRNVLVRVTNVPGDFPPPAVPAIMTQEDCMFRPRVMAVVAGQTLAVKNGDETLHNVHTYKGPVTLFNQAQLAGSPAIEKKFSDNGALLKVKCDIHPWMTAYVAVSPNPFFAVTGEDGSFAIKDVPVGKYTIEAWHERFGTRTAEVSVASGAPSEAKFTFDGTVKP